MRALVTGGTGFVGRHLVKALADKGVSVRLFVRKKGRLNNSGADGLDVISGDMTKRETLTGIASDVDIVFHLAAQMGTWGIPASQYKAVNVRGTEYLIDEVLSGAAKQFIFVSTPGVQGKGHARAREDLPYNPPYDYERTKCEAEKTVLRMGEKTGLPVTIIRPDFVYGPGDTRRISLYRAIQKRRFFIVGNGRSVLHPTYVSDVVQGFMLAMNNPAAFGEIYNIAGPEPISVKAYVEILCRSLKAPSPSVSVPKGLALAAALIWEGYSKIRGREPILSRSKIEFLTRDHGSDITKARMQLGYDPEVTFSKGMAMTADWLRRNKLLL